MTVAKKRFSGIGSISPNSVPAVASPQLSKSITTIPATGEPHYAGLFRSSLLRISGAFSGKTALVSFMSGFNGGLHAAAFRSNDKLTIEQSAISKSLLARAEKLSLSGADHAAIEEAMALWEESELLLISLLDKATVHSQLRLI